MGVRICEVCGRRVLVSKANYTEEQGPNSVSPMGVIGMPWIAHNVCAHRERSHALCNRLLEACGGDLDQVKLVVRLLP